MTRRLDPGRGDWRPNRVGRPEGTLDIRGLVLGGWIRVTPPDVAVPFWREEDGSRQSYRSLRCGVDTRTAARLAEAHLAAIHVIATAAVDAAERGDHRDTARLACAAARLCDEIRGFWPPSAHEGRTN
jgi:hypothetical protein